MANKKVTYSTLSKTRIKRKFLFFEVSVELVALITLIFSAVAVAAQFYAFGSYKDEVVTTMNMALSIISLVFSFLLLTATYFIYSKENRYGYIWIRGLTTLSAAFSGLMVSIFALQTVFFISDVNWIWFGFYVGLALLTTISNMFFAFGVKALQLKFHAKESIKK